MKQILIIYFFFVAFFSYSQDTIVIKGNFKNNTRFAKVIVQKFNIGATNIAVNYIDKETGFFTIKAPKKGFEQGIYRFVYSQHDMQYIDVILDGKESNIYFEFDCNVIEQGPEFIESETNKKWYSYKKNELTLKKDIYTLYSFLVNYSKKDSSLWQHNKEQYTILIKNYYKELEDYLNSSPGFWAEAMIKNQPQFFPDINEHWKINDSVSQDNYWNGINTSSPDLINSPLYSELIIDYLQYYINPLMEFSEKEREEGFIKCIDTIMTVFNSNEEMQKYALSLLQLGFKEMGQERVLQYLDENYSKIAEQCQDDANKAAFEARMKGYQAIKIGAKAPLIELKIDNKTYNLETISNEKVLVIFWASWCPHCMKIMPKLNQWALEHPEIKILAVSLDTDETAFNSTIKSFTNMLHYCDYKQWQSKPVEDYYIYGTPTMILLDENRNIETKFLNEVEFVKYFDIK